MKRNIKKSFAKVDYEITKLKSELEQKGNVSTNRRNSKARASLNDITTNVDQIKEDRVSQGTDREEKKKSVRSIIRGEDENADNKLIDLDEYLENLHEEIDAKFNVFVKVNIEQIKNDIVNQVMSITDLQSSKIDENLKSNSIISDHVVALKGKIEDLKK